MSTESSNKSLRLWAFGDAHVGTDKRNGRDSLTETITQSESGGTESGPSFDWDIATFSLVIIRRTSEARRIKRLQ